MHVRKYKRLFNICHLGITEREDWEDRVEERIEETREENIKS